MFLFFMGLGVGSSSTVPSHAIVAVSPLTGHFYSPFCLPVAEEHLPRLIRVTSQAEFNAVLGSWGLHTTTVEGATGSEYTPDPACRDAGHFVQDGRSLSGNLLEAAGILGSKPSRWNEDGTWNW